MHFQRKKNDSVRHQRFIDEKRWPNSPNKLRYSSLRQICTANASIIDLPVILCKVYAFVRDCNCTTISNFTMDFFLPTVPGFEFPWIPKIKKFKRRFGFDTSLLLISRLLLATIVDSNKGASCSNVSFDLSRVCLAVAVILFILCFSCGFFPLGTVNVHGSWSVSFYAYVLATRRGKQNECWVLFSFTLRSDECAAIIKVLMQIKKKKKKQCVLFVCRRMTAANTIWYEFENDLTSEFKTKGKNYNWQYERFSQHLWCKWQRWNGTKRKLCKIVKEFLFCHNKNNCFLFLSKCNAR